MPERTAPAVVVPEERGDLSQDLPVSAQEFPVPEFDPDHADPQRRIREILAVVREFNGADVAYVGEFRETRQVLRWIAGDSASFGFQVGVGIPLAETFCNELVAGRLPGIVRGARIDARTRDLPFTNRASVGSYAGAPIRLSDGTLFGTLCTLSHATSRSLGERHERFMSLLAPVVGEQIEEAARASSDRRTRFEHFRRTVDAAQSVRVALQPIVDLGVGNIVGYEALARFPDGRSPDHWFAEAWEAGLGVDLELTALRIAFHKLDEIPRGAYLSVNVSPAGVLAPGLADALEELGVDRERIILELTEHDEVRDYEPLIQALAPLRASGVRVAVDDVGAGFASLRHVLHLGPDVLKLDVSLTHGIERDETRAALASLFVSFAARIGASVVAEGIESERELAALRALGVPCGQGFYFARAGETTGPAPASPGREPSAAAMGRRPVDLPYLR
jgi:EAL domain-containing protein (putative c-di-GMP-specific phosphodiesterase class I)